MKDKEIFTERLSRRGFLGAAAARQEKRAHRSHQAAIHRAAGHLRFHEPE